MKQKSLYLSSKFSSLPLHALQVRQADAHAIAAKLFRATKGRSDIFIVQLTLGLCRYEGSAPNNEAYAQKHIANVPIDHNEIDNPNGIYVFRHLCILRCTHARTLAQSLIVNFKVPRVCKSFPLVHDARVVRQTFEYVFGHALGTD